MDKDELFWSHQTTLVSDGSSARGARAFVRQHLLDHQQPGLVEDVRSVASELAELVIAQQGHSSFTVSLRGGGGEVLLLVQDGFSEGTVEGLLGTGVSVPGDPQLFITERLSERWGIARTAPTGAVVWASFAAK
jgi:hypothetical protein